MFLDLIKLYNKQKDSGRIPLEDFNTECFANILKLYPEIKQDFILNFLNLPIDDYDVSTQLRRDLEDTQNCIIDLVLIGKSNACLIECKVESSEGWEQLFRYGKVLEIYYSEKKKYLIYLTQYSDIKNQDRQYDKFNFNQYRWYHIAKFLKKRTIEKIIKSILPQKSNHLKIINNKESQSLANLHQLNALLIGFHIILKKRSEGYSEDRSTIRLRYDDSNELYNVENKYLLIKKESQAGNLKNEISFSINSKKVNLISENLKTNKFVKIIYVDEASTQKINHPYFNNKFWSNELETKSIISFLRNGLSTYLLMLTKQVDIKDEKDNSLWFEKKKRLKLLSICAILNYHWTSAYSDTKSLLLLNIFYYLGENEDFDTFEKEVEFYIGKLNLRSFITDERFFELIDLYTDYLSWFQQYKKDVKSLKSELNRFSENEIIFHHCYGFAKVNHFYNDKTVNLESPLGIYNAEKGKYGFENVFIGFTPVFFREFTQ